MRIMSKGIDMDPCVCAVFLSQVDDYTLPSRRHSLSAGGEDSHMAILDGSEMEESVIEHIGQNGTVVGTSIINVPM